MNELKVSGATLQYDVEGSGPLLLFIAGAQGSGDVFRAVAAELTNDFTVLTYDRRGFSRSTLDGPQDYTRRLEIDAEDVASLIQHVGDGPANIFGSSSGAIVALTVLSRHPKVIRTLIAHEPPLARFLPRGEEVVQRNYDIYDKYRSEGIPAAMKDFMALWMPSPTSDHLAFSRLSGQTVEPRIEQNMRYWFEHELRQYPSTQLDLEKLRCVSDRLALAMGEEMHNNPTTQILHALSDETGAPIIDMPCGHVGYAVHPAEYARRLTEYLNAKPDNHR